MSMFFGDPKVFAIRFDESKNDQNYKILHLCILNQILGDINELCYYPTWISSMRRLYSRIKYREPLFNDPALLDTDLFSLIENSKNDPPPTQWGKSLVTIDETIDSWIIFSACSSEKVAFLWEGLKSPCPSDLVGKKFSLVIDKKIVLEAMENMFCFFKEEIPYR